jgi:uncharacterized phage-associated protein
MLPGIGVVRLHKLLYYSQGHHLALTDTALFGEEMRAFKNGPVVKNLWRNEKYGGYPLPEPKALTDLQLATLRMVVSRYGDLSPDELIARTHAEPPWSDAWTRGNDVMPIESLREFFGQTQESKRLRRILGRATTEPLRRPSGDRKPDKPSQIAYRLQLALAASVR